MDANELKHKLAYFIGTEHWYRYDPLFPKLLITDGVKFLAEEAGAYWLVDVVGSHLPSVKDTFAIAYLQVNADKSADFTLSGDLDEDRDEKGIVRGVRVLDVYAQQHIEYTDFPLDVIKLYLVRDPENWVLLLPSEY